MNMESPPGINTPEEAGLPDEDHNNKEFMQCKELLLEAYDVRSSIRKAASQAEVVMAQLQASISKDYWQRQPPAAVCSPTLENMSMPRSVSITPKACTSLTPSCGGVLKTAPSTSNKTFTEFYKARRAIPECPVLPCGFAVRSYDSKLGQMLAQLRPVSPLPIVQQQLLHHSRWQPSADKSWNLPWPTSPVKSSIHASSTSGKGLVTAPDRAHSNISLVAKSKPGWSAHYVHGLAAPQQRLLLQPWNAAETGSPRSRTNSPQNMLVLSTFAGKDNIAPVLSVDQAEAAKSEPLTDYRCMADSRCRGLASDTSTAIAAAITLQSPRPAALSFPQPLAVSRHQQQHSWPQHQLCSQGLGICCQCGPNTAAKRGECNIHLTKVGQQLQEQQQAQQQEQLGHPSCPCVQAYKTGKKDALEERATTGISSVTSDYAAAALAPLNAVPVHAALSPGGPLLETRLEALAANTPSQAAAPCSTVAGAQLTNELQAYETAVINAPYNDHSDQLAEQQGNAMLGEAEDQLADMLQQLAAVQGLLIDQGPPYDHQQLEELSEQLQQLLAASGPEHEQLLRQVLVQQQELLAAQAGQLWAGVEHHDQQPDPSNAPNESTSLVHAQQPVWPAAAAVNLQPVDVQLWPGGSSDRTQAWVTQQQQLPMGTLVQRGGAGTAAVIAGNAAGYTGRARPNLEQTAGHIAAPTPGKLAGVGRLNGSPVQSIGHLTTLNNITAAHPGELSLPASESIRKAFWQQQGNSQATHALISNQQPHHSMQGADLEEALDDEAEYVRAVYGQAMAGSAPLVHYMMGPRGDSSSGILRQGPAQVTAVAQVLHPVLPVFNGSAMPTASEPTPAVSAPSMMAQLQTANGVEDREGIPAAMGRNDSYLPVLADPAGPAPLPVPGSPWNTIPALASAAGANATPVQLRSSEAYFQEQHALQHSQQKRPPAVGALHESPGWQSLQPLDLPTAAIPSQFQHLVQSRDAERSYIEGQLKRLQSSSSNRGGDSSGRSPDSTPVSAATTPKQSRLSHAIGSNGNVLAGQPQHQQPQQEQQPPSQHARAASGVWHTESGIATQKQSVRFVQPAEVVHSSTAASPAAAQQAQQHVQQAMLQHADRPTEHGSPSTSRRSLTLHLQRSFKQQASLRGFEQGNLTGIASSPSSMQPASNAGQQQHPRPITGQQQQLLFQGSSSSGSGGGAGWWKQQQMQMQAQLAAQLQEVRHLQSLNSSAAVSPRSSVVSSRSMPLGQQSAAGSVAGWEGAPAGTTGRSIGRIESSNKPTGSRSASAAAPGIVVAPAAQPAAPVNIAEAVEIAARWRQPPAEAAGKVKMPVSAQAVPTCEGAPAASRESALWPPVADDDRGAAAGGQVWQPISNSTDVISCDTHQEQTNRRSSVQASKPAGLAVACIPLARQSKCAVGEAPRSAVDGHAAAVLRSALLRRMQRERQGRLLQMVLNAWWRHTAGSHTRNSNGWECIDSSSSSSHEDADLPDLCLDSCEPQTAGAKVALNHLGLAGQLLHPVHGRTSAVNDQQQLTPTSSKGDMEWILSGQVRLQQSSNRKSPDLVPSAALPTGGEVISVAHPVQLTASSVKKTMANSEGRQQEAEAVRSVNCSNGQKQLKPLREALHDLHDIIEAMEQLCHPCACADGALDSWVGCSPGKLQVDDAHTADGLPLVQTRLSATCGAGGLGESSSACQLQRQGQNMQPVSNRGRPMNIHLLRGQLHKVQDRLGTLEAKMLMAAAFQDTGVGNRKSTLRCSSNVGLGSALQHLPPAKDRRVTGSTAGKCTQVALEPRAGAAAEARHTSACAADVISSRQAGDPCQYSTCHADDESDGVAALTPKQQVLVRKMQHEVDDMTRELYDMKRLLPHVYGLAR